MKIRKRISLWLYTFYQQYERIPGSLGYIISVMMMLAMAAAFVHNPQYWIVVLGYQPFFAGPDSFWSEPDWHTWRLFALIELILAGLVWFSCWPTKYGQTIWSTWCLGWFLIPLVIFVWWFVSWVVVSFLDWRFQISLCMDDVAYVFFYTTLLMMLSQMPLALIAVKSGEEAEYERP